jgi:hypothetical protein
VFRYVSRGSLHFSVAQQRAAQAKTSSKGAHPGSIAEFNNTLARAMTDLKRFDALEKTP